MSVNESCCVCGVAFCLPTGLYNARRKDGETFYCPNGHAQVYVVEPTEDQKQIASLERLVKRLQVSNNETWATREDLIGVLKECPVIGCTWRSRKQIPRDPVSMGRGIERVRYDLLAHLVQVHSSRAQEPLALEAGS